MQQELTRWRDDFPTLARKTYLVSSSLGAMPRAAKERLVEFASEWEDQGAAAWSGWLALGTEVSEMIGRLIGAPAGTVVMHQNVSAMSSVLASCYDFVTRRNKVVLTDLEPPSVAYVWLEQRRRGAKVEVLRATGDREEDTGRLLDAIDERTALVPLSYVLFRNGAVQHVEAVIEKAHRVGARVLLDAYQAVGCMPVDVASLGVDFCTGGAAKWLCGGPGAAWLYVREDLVPRLRPAACGWLSHARPHSYEVGAIDFAPGIERFRGGSPSVSSLCTAKIGCEIISKIGPDLIRQRSLHLTRGIIERARSLDLKVTTPVEDDWRGGIVALDFEGAEVCPDWLADRDILVDWRPAGGLRISPHFYNTEAECDRVIDHIEEYRRRPRSTE